MSEDGSPRGYSFVLSRDYPKVWCDRIDIVAISSISITVFGIFAYIALKANIEVFSEMELGIEASNIPGYYILISTLLCLSATVYWLALKMRVLNIDYAPRLSRISIAIRAFIYLCAIWLPSIFIYAYIVRYVNMYYDSHGAYNPNYTTRFLQNVDPWSAYYSMSLCSIILVLYITIRRYGSSIALASLIASIVYGIVIIFASILLSNIFPNYPIVIGSGSTDDRIFSIALSIVTLVFVSGLILRKPSYIRNMLIHIPGMYFTTFIPWLFLLGILLEIQTSSAIETISTVVLSFLFSSLLVALRWNIGRRE